MYVDSVRITSALGHVRGNFRKHRRPLPNNPGQLSRILNAGASPAGSCILYAKFQPLDPNLPIRTLASALVQKVSNREATRLPHKFHVMDLLDIDF